MTEPKKEALSWQAHAKVEKWHDSADHEAGAEPDEVVEVPGNSLLTAGITRLSNLLIGAGGQAYDNTHTRIGVGNSSTGVTVGDTDLGASSGSSNRQFMVMDATYPSLTTGVITFRATFGTSVGNFAWNEWGIDGGTANGTTVTAPLLNRKVVSLGTKASGATWVFTVTITIS